jgi:hypothetical protein
MMGLIALTGPSCKMDSDSQPRIRHRVRERPSLFLQLLPEFC